MNQKLLIRLSLSIVFLLVQIPIALAQTHTVSGVIKNGFSKQRISSINLAVKGVSNSTNTNSEGEFSLQIPDTMRTITFADFEGMDIMEVEQISKYLSQEN